MMILGVDEAGRGPVLGPMVVAGVLIKEEEVPRLEELGLRDSKRLQPKQREQLAPIIKDLATCYVRVVSAGEIDSREAGGLNRLEARVFGEVLQELKPRVAYVDAADVNPGRFAWRLKQEYKCRIVAEHGADDRYGVVSAASIIAKVYRDQKIREIEGELGVRVGSGYPSDPVTRRFLEKWVREHGDLPPYCRRTWKTAKDILNSKKQATLF